MARPRRSGVVSSATSATATTIATPIPSPRAAVAVSISDESGCGSAYTRLGTAVISWPATSRREDDHRDISHGVSSSPATATMNRAAVAAPAAPCGPRRSTSTGTTGSSMLNVTAVDVAIPASTSGGDVAEDLSSRDRGADLEAGSRPDMPVLGDDDPFGGLVADKDPAAKGRVDDVADDHPVGGGTHGLDGGLDVHAGVQPDRPAAGAPSQHRAVAVAPLAAEPEAVRLPRRQWELEVIGRGGRHDDPRRRGGHARREDGRGRPKPAGGDGRGGGQPEDSTAHHKKIRRSG